MDSSCKKIYGIDNINNHNLTKQYFSSNYLYASRVEATMDRMLLVYKSFSTGIVTGKTLIDFCTAPILLHIFPLKDSVEDITLVQINDEGVQDIEKWLTKHPDACDWSHAAGIVKKLKGISDELEDEEEKIRGKIKVLKWDISGDNPAEALSLKEADIVTCMWFLEGISKDHDEYRRYLREVSDVVKPKGFLIIQTNVNSSYFTVGEETFHFLPCDESFYRKLLCEEGFTIKHCERFRRVTVADNEGGIYIVAQKMSEPQNRERSEP